VRLLVEGQEITELWGHEDWSQPIRPDDFTLSPVVIEDVTVEADGVVTVSGSAMTYEGTVELALVDPADRVVQTTFATATCGGPCRGEWTHTFESPALLPGAWSVEAAAPAVTDEGPPPFRATAEFLVE
jgi:hypothetical protein